jgi:hypothetical protein
MDFHKIECLEDLEKAVNLPNPVNIAGYGKESTHKGYLSWILDSKRWEMAERAFISLCSAAVSQNNSKDELPKEAKDLEILFEMPLNKRKVDLLIRFTSEGIKMAVPIELKTDSGPSGEKQLEELSKPERFDTAQIPLRIVLLLGSSCVQSIENYGRFFPLRPKQIIMAINHFQGYYPEFCKDWIQSIQMEIDRFNFVMNAYKSNLKDKYKIYGYRSPSHLMFYVLDHIRRYLINADPGCTWKLYPSQHNTVLNLSVEGSWIKLKDDINAQAYFEFNDDRFVLKLWKKGSNDNNLRELIRDIQQAVKNDPLGSQTKVKLSGDSVSLCSWPMNFEHLEKCTEQVLKIVKDYGKDGFLSKYI